MTSPSSTCARGLRAHVVRGRRTCLALHRRRGDRLPARPFPHPESVQSGEPARLLDTARTLGRAQERGWRVRRDGTAFYAAVVIQAIT